ncbi:MAG TPA: pitrilysin family protein [Candidatus Polarisedimenticolia bacterium]|nr:pitrilysin family protein [Candidatus Polarisedimenticolia bacterium]
MTHRHRTITASFAGAVLAAAIASALPAAAQVKDHRQIQHPPMRPFSVPEPERITLPNGMVVMLMEDHELPLIEAFARIRTGTRLDPPGKAGLGTIFGQVLRTGGTRRMTGDQLDDFLESRAAEIETGVGPDSGFANMSCLSQDFPEVAKVFAEILREPVFAEDKITIAKTAVRAGIARRNDNPQQIVFREFNKLIYGDSSPYAVVPEYATVDAITRDDLVAHHRKHVQPNRIILGVVGDFSAKQMAATLRDLFKDWPKGPAAGDPAAAIQAKVSPGIRWIQKEDMTQSNIVMGHLGIQRDNPDFFAVEVLNETYGGSFAARLFSNVRSRKGLAYTVNGGVRANYDYPGTFNTFMTTKTETTAAGLDALLEEIDAIVKNPPSEAEIKRAKESILNSFVFNFASRSQILNQQITYAYFGFPADYLARYRENIEKVSAADVARAAARYVHKDQLAILVVGPSKGHDRPLESFGKVTRLDISIPEPKAAAAPAATKESVARGRALLDKIVSGLGGAAAVDAVKATRITSSMTAKTPQGEMNLKVVATVSLPDRLRQELDTPMGRMVTVLAGQDGFMVMPGMAGAQPLPDSRRADMARSLRRQALVLAQHRADASLKVQHAGTEGVDGTQAEILLAALGEDEVRLWVDPASGRVLRQAYRGQGPAGPAEFTVRYSDFRQVAGLTLPHKNETLLDGEVQQSAVVERIEVNPPVDAALFAKPESAPASGDGKR